MNHLRPVLSRSPAVIELVAGTYSRQKDAHNCGVFALVCALFLCVKLDIPMDVDPLNWRRLFLALASGLSLDAVLPANVRGVVEDVSLPSGDEIGIPTNPIELIHYHRLQAERLGRLTADAYKSRQRSIHEVADWLRIQAMEPVNALHAAAQTEIPRLEDIIARVKIQEEDLADLIAKTLHVARSSAGFGPLMSAQVVNGIKSKLKSAVKLRQHQ